MAKLNHKNGITSVLLRVLITNSSTGVPLTGLTSASSGLIISTITDNEATAAVFTVAAGNVEGITTLGTFETPTTNKARFKEVDATNHKGLYEIQIANARWAVSSARTLIVTVSGATDAAQVDAEIQLDPVPSNVTQIVDSIVAAVNQRQGALGIVSSTAKTGTLSVTQMSTNLTEGTAEHYNGATIIWLTGVLAGQRSQITDFDDSGGDAILTYIGVTDAPANNDEFILV